MPKKSYVITATLIPKSWVCRDFKTVIKYLEEAQMDNVLEFEFEVWKHRLQKVCLGDQ